MNNLRKHDTDQTIHMYLRACVELKHLREEHIVLYYFTSLEYEFEVLNP